MNNMKKDAAVKRYGPQYLETKDTDVIRKAIAADAKGYSDAEVDEILESVLAFTGADAVGKASKGTPDAGDTKVNQNSNYEEWAVEPKYEEKRPKGGQPYRELTGYEKIKQLRTTAITPDRAEELNKHSETSLVRLYLADGKKSK